MQKRSFFQIAVGIDIAKSSFRACIMGDEGQKKYKVLASSKFNNTAVGFEVFWDWVQKHLGKHNYERVEYLMEATGVYHENLAWYLHEKSVRVVIALPVQVKSFFKSEGIHSKTDKMDAQGLAKMSLIKDLRPWQPISAAIRELRFLTRYHEQLQKSLTQSRNRLHALTHSHQPTALVVNLLREQITVLEQQKKNIKEQIIEQLKTDEQLYAKAKYLTSIHGVGLLTAAVIIAETNGFELFKSQSQLTSFAGYDVLYDQSGTIKGKTRISKKGNTHIRRILYMPALCAVKRKGVFKDLYDRVFEKSKRNMKAYTAVQRKLLMMMYTLWKKEENFDYHRNQIKFVEEQDALLH